MRNNEDGDTFELFVDDFGDFGIGCGIDARSRLVKDQELVLA
jgi:hypothetical protein